MHIRSRSRDRSRFGGGFFPGQLFFSGAQGAWYDPSDFSTLFQDAAGTTPVTAVEQPVRLMLDRSGRGNNATAPNDASRPVLRARYNLLERSQEINSSPWANASTAANTTIAPDGTLTGDTITFSGSGTRSQDGNATITAGSVFTFSIWLKAGTATSLRIGIARSGAGTYEQTLSPILTVTSEWQRFSVSHTYANAQTGWRVTINGTGGTLDVWGAQLLTAADQAATGGAYQRVGAATDYDTGPPWRPYLAFDGSDDSMSTSSIDFSGTDEVTLFAGVTKLSDAAQGTIVELSGDINNNGIFLAIAPQSANEYFWRSKGTSVASAIADSVTYAAPVTNVFTGIGDIGADKSILRLDGLQVDLDSGDQGTGNFGNYPLFIGRRNNASNPFNGRFYSLAVLGRTATAPELTAMESWIAGKTGVTI